MVEAVDAVELHAAVVDQVRDGPDHAVVLVVPGASGLAGEHDHRPAVVAVPDDGACPVEADGVQLDVLPLHLVGPAPAKASRSARATSSRSASGSHALSSVAMSPKTAGPHASAG